MPNTAADVAPSQKRATNRIPEGSLYVDTALPATGSNLCLDMQRPPEKEKGRRLRSCRECQRLKLRCDRAFQVPCSSCRKRGVHELCPDGALVSGRGSRFILANTEQLHDKILQLSERVRQLEDGLGVLQSSVSSDPHPLLSPELLRTKISQDLYVQSSQSDSSSLQKEDCLRASISTLSLNGPESVQENSTRSNLAESPPPEVHPDVLQLSTTFPFPWAVNLKIRKLIRDALPPRENAMAICQEARSNALWQYNLDASETFLQNLLHHCYTSPIEKLSPRRLALLLMVLSIGSLVDLNRPLGSLHGEAYHHLARASVCEIPLMEEPDFDVLHALFFMLWYHLIFSDNNKAVGYAWNLLGFVAKLAQGLGLHRDGHVKLIPEEHEKRRLVFWELMNIDTRMSLSLGRPPSIYLGHVDIKPPSYTAQGLYVPREEIIYHEWKNSFMIHCLNPILEAMVSVNALPYAHTIDLDCKVRNFGVPAELSEHHPDVSHRFWNMQRALVASGIDIALLQLHRRYFTETMNSSFDFNHQYAPSVLSTYLSVSSLIATVEALYEREQQLSVRFLCFWFNAFSAAVTLSLLVSRAPYNALAPFALQDLDRVSRLFHRAAQILPFSGKSLPAMERLTERARHAYLQWRNNDQSLYLGQSIPTQGNFLPDSFLGAHPMLCQHVMKLTSTSSAPLYQPFDMQSVNMVYQPYLPDIYHFSSNGIALDERYTIAQKPPTPFMPSSPRVDENEAFNFDHGAITADLEDTSYMAWF